MDERQAAGRHFTAQGDQELCEVDCAVAVAVKGTNDKIELLIIEVNTVVVQAPLEVVAATSEHRYGTEQ